MSEPQSEEQGVIPFHWRFQPFEDEKYWCHCLRCRKALNNLVKHLWARFGYETGAA